MYEPGTSSGSIGVTAGTQVITGPGVLLISQLTGAAVPGAVVVYDGTSTAGTVLSNIAVLANTTQNATVEGGMVFNTGLFVVVTGVGASALVCYRRN